MLIVSDNDLDSVQYLSADFSSFILFIYIRNSSFLYLFQISD